MRSSKNKHGGLDMIDLFYNSYKDGKLDEQVSGFLYELSNNDSISMWLQTPEEVRKNNDVTDWVLKRDRPFKVNTILIPVDGSCIRLRIYTPKGNGPFPVLAYFHGGGWVFGTLDEADHICSYFSNEIPAVVVSIDYRLSPEYKYPRAIEDVYAAILWIENEIATYNGNPKYIGVAGESAGANMATVVCQMLRDRKGPKICYQLLICPWVDLLHTDTKSYQLFGDGIWLSKSGIEYYRNQYLGSVEESKDPYVSPILSEDLANLPPAHIITAEFDVLRDEGETYAQKLLEAGNRVTLKQYKGMIHSFIILNRRIDKANEAIDDCISILKDAIYKERNK